MHQPLNVLVAGGAGFIGSHLCAALIERGDRVLCIDNLCTGSIANVARLMNSGRFTLDQSDVARVRSYHTDLILHLASPASPVHYRRLAIETMHANSAGTERLLEVAREHDARFVFASTSEVYGEPLAHPQPETYWGNVNPNGPRACYDESKRFGEALTLEYHRRYGVAGTIVRIFNTYGPAMALGDGRVIPEFIAAALRGQPLPIEGDGSQTRSFCFVSDLVDGILAVAGDRSSYGEVFNLGNPEEHSIRELAEIVAGAVGIPASFDFRPAAPDSPTRRRPEIARVRGRYGWEPRVGLAHGIAVTVGDFAERLQSPIEQAV